MGSNRRRKGEREGLSGSRSGPAVLAVIVSGSLVSLGEVAGSQDPGRFATTVPLAETRHLAEIPPTIVRVQQAPTIPPMIVDRALDEAGAIWRAIGVTFVWERDEPDLSHFPDPMRPRVIINDSRGTPRDMAAPLAWITFIGEEPDGDIHISRRNAEQVAFGTTVGKIRQVTPAERALLLGRMLGRALAHEIGHYLLRSKTHSAAGLMKGRRTAKEFIDAPLHSFALEPAEREVAVRQIRELHANHRNRPAGTTVRLTPAARPTW